MSDKKLKFHLLSRQGYFKDLENKLAEAKPSDRATVMTMQFRAERRDIQPLIQALNKAANRGVNVRFITDAYTFLVGENGKPGPLLVKDDVSGPMLSDFKSRLGTLSQLGKNGGSYYVINKPKRILANPYSGRSHIKLAIVNDFVYVGGCNISRTDETDLMVRLKDKQLANWLSEFVDKVVQAKSVKRALKNKDATYEIDQLNEILIDCGAKKQSLILDKAISLIDGSKERVFLATQYFPSTDLANRLKKAQQRGVRIKVIYNNPMRLEFPQNILMSLSLRRQKTHLSEDFFTNELSKDKQYLHAKLLATESAAMVGSHNFAASGVDFGTAEMALLTRDINLVSRLESFIKAQLSE